MPAAQGSCPSKIARGAAIGAFLRARALYSTTALLVATTTGAADTRLPECLEGQPVEFATVLRIVDGDTLVLANRQRVRLIGFNAPEKAHDGRRGSAEPRADDATLLLETLLPSGTTVTLVPGYDPEDRHGRRLAHVIAPGGRSVAEPLLQQGLAAQSAVAPNTRCAKHFRALEEAARYQRLGVWQAGGPWQREAPRLRSEHAGFRIVTGSVTAIEDRHDRIWLALNGPLRISMTRKQANVLHANSLIGQTIEVRGWLQRDGKRLKLALQHPANLRVLATAGANNH